jgi:protein gp37
MGENSKIEWCHHTDNIWEGCDKVHDGCTNCYAEARAIRFKFDIWGADKPRKLIKTGFTNLARLQKKASELNEMHRVFINSLSDVFEKPKPLISSSNEPLGVNTGILRGELFSNISMGMYPNLMFLLLTKRPSNISKYIPEKWLETPPANVMFGTSPCDQKTFDTLWWQLARVNGKRFLSIEPQLAEIILKAYCPSCEKLLAGSMSHRCGTCHSETIRPDWIINGGESGKNKRPFDLSWAYTLRDACKTHSVPFFFKQIDKVQAIPDDLLIREFYK